MKKILLLEICLLFIATTFQSDNPPGWYQQTLPVSKQITDIYFADTLNGWATTTWAPEFDTAYILHTTNGGDNWSIQLQQPISFNVMSFPTGSIGYAGGGDGLPKLYKTINGGINWSLIISPSMKRILDMQFVTSDTGWVCDDDPLVGGLYRTTNGGISWNVQLGTSARPTKLFFINKDTGWAASQSTHLLKTTNGGQNWIDVYQSQGEIGAIFFLTPLKGWMRGGLIGSNGISYTTDGGFNWIQSQGTIGGFDIKFVNDSIGYTGMQSFRILKSTDGGKNWGYQNSPVYNNMSISFLKGDTIHGWAGGNGIVHTLDGGGVILPVEQISSEIPADFKLFQNYPNPFNPTTTINYELRTKSDIRLIIYDITGKEIGGVAYMDQLPGLYSYKFDGAGLPSGIYFYKLTAGGFIDTKKMILVK